MTTMKITQATRSTTLKAASGEMRSLARKMRAPVSPVTKAAATYTMYLVRMLSTPTLCAAGSESRTAVRAGPGRERASPYARARDPTARASAIRKVMDSRLDSAPRSPSPP